MKNTKLKIVLSIIFCILMIVMIGVRQYYVTANDELERKISNINVPQKVKFEDRLKIEKVKELEVVMKEKTDRYLSVNLKEGQFDYSNSSVDVLHELFFQAGDDVILKSTPLHKLLDYYDQYNYEYKDFAAIKTGSGYEIYAHPVITKNGKVINKDIKMIAFSLNEKMELTGGRAFYGE